MTLGGWCFMIVSVVFTTGGFAWCVWKVLKTPRSTERVHGVLDTEVRIEDEDKRR